MTSSPAPHPNFRLSGCLQSIAPATTKGQHLTAYTKGREWVMYCIALFVIARVCHISMLLLRLTIHSETLMNDYCYGDEYQIPSALVSLKTTLC